MWASTRLHSRGGKDSIVLFGDAGLRWREEFVSHGGPEGHERGGAFMINKMREEWDLVEQAAKEASEPDPQEWKTVLQSIKGVREVLKKMCEVSVTRTTLKNAVTEALVAILKEHGRDLFPELFSELDRLRAQIEKIAAQAAGGAALPAAPGADRAVAGLRGAAYGAVSPEVTAQLKQLEEKTRRIGELEAGYDEWIAKLEKGLKKTEERVADVSARVNVVGARLDGTSGELGKVGERFVEIDERLTAIRRRIEDAWADSEARRTNDVAQLRGTLEAELRGGLAAVGEKVEKARADFLALLGKVEAAVPSAVEQKTGELEAKVRKEIEEMVQNLSEKLSELRDMLARLEEILPRREDVKSVDRRLGRVESAFDKVAAQVENIDSLTPEIRNLDGRFAELRNQLSVLSSDVGDTGRSVKEGFSSELAELKGLLESGIERWEADQAQSWERLSAIRDTLRDQLRMAGEHVKTRDTLLGRMIGRREGTLKLSPGEWDQLAAKIEGVISGIEAILSKKKG